MITIYKSLFFGVLQGLTEFLPVSSSGHLALFQKFLNFPVPIYFDVFVHTGTMLATILYFRKEIIKIFGGLCSSDSCQKNNSIKFIVFLILSTLFTIVIAFPLKDRVETAFNSLKFVKWSFLFTAIVLLLTSFKKEHTKDIATMNKLDAILIGIAQGIAVFPGISRSGMTISAGLFAGLKRDFVAVYSFLLSIVIIFLVTLYQFMELWTGPAHQILWKPTIVATVASFVAGYAALALLIPIVKRGKFHYFAFYLLALFILLNFVR